MSDTTERKSPATPDPRITPDPNALAAWRDRASVDPRVVAAYLTTHHKATTAKRVRALVRDNAARIIGREWPEARTVHAYKPDTAARVVAVALTGGTGADPL